MDLIEIIKYLSKDETELDSLSEKQLDEIEQALNEIRNSLGLTYDFVYFRRYYLNRKMKEAAPLVKTGKKFNLNQKEKRNKRQTWGGLTKEQIKERDQKIIDKFKNSKLSMNSFAEKHKIELELSPSKIRTIIRPAKKNKSL